jgi:AcrR family transcriptional regulator
VPKLSDQTRARRRQHILTSAWSCFSRNGFHATSMDDVIAASGMSSSAVYRYFRGKEELIEATTDEGLAKVRQIFVDLLANESCRRLLRRWRSWSASWITGWKTPNTT